MCLALKIVSPRLIANRSEHFQIGANLRAASRDLWPASVHKGKHWAAALTSKIHLINPTSYSDAFPVEIPNISGMLFWAFLKFSKQTGYGGDPYHRKSLQVVYIDHEAISQFCVDIGAPWPSRRKMIFVHTTPYRVWDLVQTYEIHSISRYILRNTKNVDLDENSNLFQNGKKKFKVGNSFKFKFTFCILHFTTTYAGHSLVL